MDVEVLLKSLPARDGGGSLRKDFELWAGIKSLIDSTTTHPPPFLGTYISQNIHFTQALCFENTKYFMCLIHLSSFCQSYDIMHQMKKRLEIGPRDVVFL